MNKKKNSHYPQQDNARDDHIVFEGVIEEVLPGTNFRILVDESETRILCGISGSMRKNRIRVLLGDRVRVSVSPYDLTRGFITRRL